MTSSSPLFRFSTSEHSVRIGVLGAGSYGLTLATLWASQGKPVWVWGRRPAHVQLTEETVTIPFSDAVETQPRPKTLRLETDFDTAPWAETDVLVLAVSSQGTAALCERLASLPLQTSTVLVNVSKGLVDSTDVSQPDALGLRRQSELISAMLPHNPQAILSGPCLAKELALGLPTAVCLASETPGLAQALLPVLSHERCLRVYASADVAGVELGGALKNIYAIGSGYLSSQGLGQNALSAYITRSLAEMTRVAVSLGADAETLVGLSGLGDLLTTCHSPLSRNYQIGVRLAEGQPLVEVMRNLVGVAEGVETTRRILAWAAQNNVDVPLASAIGTLLMADSETPVNPKDLIQSLMSRRLKVESRH